MVITPLRHVHCPCRMSATTTGVLGNDLDLCSTEAFLLYDYASYLTMNLLDHASEEFILAPAITFTDMQIYRLHSVV